jgi:hypothetical protein
LLQNERDCGPKDKLKAQADNELKRNIAINQRNIAIFLFVGMVVADR